MVAVILPSFNSLGGIIQYVGAFLVTIFHDNLCQHHYHLLDVLVHERNI